MIIEIVRKRAIMKPGASPFKARYVFDQEGQLMEAQIDVGDTAQVQWHVQMGEPKPAIPDDVMKEVGEVIAKAYDKNRDQSASANNNLRIVTT